MSHIINIVLEKTEIFISWRKGAIRNILHVQRQMDILFF